MIKRVKYYNLLKIVGEGGMGTVYKAEDSRNGKTVAIKELDPAKAQIEDYRSRFSREERILTKLNHPNIVSPIEAFADEDTLYIAMEFVDGQSLDYKIRKISGPIPFIHARDLMIKMVEGFSHAHDVGVIHRDIKPANILISDKGELKITDFGIAKLQTGEDRTTANIKLGTLCYMSPEQLKTADVNAQSDIYSLGMTFYEMLAGVLPFTKVERDNPGSLTLRISNSDPYQLPSNFYPHIPKRIENIVMRMLNKVMNQRYFSLKEVLKELLQFDISDSERTVMAEYEKTVSFDPTILTHGIQSNSDSSASPSSSSVRNEKKIKEMTWEEKQQRAKELEAAFKERKRLEEEERHRKIQEEKRRQEEEIKRKEDARVKREEKKRADFERKRVQDELQQEEEARTLALRKSRSKKILIGIWMVVITVGLILLGYGIRNNHLKEKKLAESLPGILVDLNNNMIVVEGGTFTMGSNKGSSDELPTHSVTVGKYMIGKFEVTQELWESIMGNNPAKFTGIKKPVEQVSWYEAIEFCNKLSLKEGLQKAYSGTGLNIICDFSSNGYRLPTEAEWEYAAKGGNFSKDYTHSGSNVLDTVAFYENNSDNSTQLSGTKQPNELGIFDMNGNVWEWCWDWYGEYDSAEQISPRGPNIGTDRVLRGGSWGDFLRNCRVTNRDKFVPDGKLSSLGFRIVRTKK